MQAEGKVIAKLMTDVDTAQHTLDTLLVHYMQMEQEYGGTDRGGYRSPGRDRKVA